MGNCLKKKNDLFLLNKIINFKKKHKFIPYYIIIIIKVALYFSFCYRRDKCITIKISFIIINYKVFIIAFTHFYSTI